MRTLHAARVCCALALATSTVTAWPQAAPTPDTPTASQSCSGVVTDECVVRYFKDTQPASEIRGRLVFQNYCVLCHGTKGMGDGRAAKLHTPRPLNLTTSTAPRYYINDVIRKGGAAMGRGIGMPPWGEQLTDEQINDVLNYLFTIRVGQ
jgi:mono/diheme cytochrome c family protein